MLERINLVKSLLIINLIIMILAAARISSASLLPIACGGTHAIESLASKQASDNYIQEFSCLESLYSDSQLQCDTRLVTTGDINIQIHHIADEIDTSLTYILPNWGELTDLWVMCTRTTHYYYSHIQTHTYTRLRDGYVVQLTVGYAD